MRHFLLLPIALAAASTWAQSPAKPAGSRPAAVSAPAPAASSDELVETARQQLQAGNAQRALALAQQARRADPSSYKPTYYIAYALMALGDYAGAADAQAASLELTASPDQKAAVQALGEAIAAQGSVSEADKAAAEGLDAKAARLYKAAFDAGLQRPDIALKAAKLLEQRMKDVPGAVALLRAVQDRFPGSPEAGTAGTELSRLQPALAAVAQQRLREAFAQPRGARQQLLDDVLVIDPRNTDALFALTNEAMAGADWPQLEARVKVLLQRRLLEDGLRSGKVRLYGWKRDARLRTLLEDAWGPEAAGKALNTAARASLKIQTAQRPEAPDIRTVTPNGPGQKGGLAVGDQVVSVSGMPVRIAEDVLREVAMLPAGLPAAFVVRRAQQLHTLYVTPENYTDQAGDCIALGITYLSYEGDCKDGFAEGMGTARYTAVNDIPATYVGGFKNGFPSGKGQTTLQTASGPKVFEILDGRQVGQ